MLSSISGVAMKAKGKGTIIGIALEDFSGDRMYSDTYINQFIDNLASSTKDDIEEELTNKKSRTAYTSEGDGVKIGQVVMFVNLQERFLDDETASNLALLMGTSLPTTLPSEDTIFTKLMRLADSFVDGVLSILSLKAERVEVGEVLCVEDDICLTEPELQILLERAGAQEAAENYIDTTEQANEEASNEASESDQESNVVTIIPTTSPDVSLSLDEAGEMIENQGGSP
jgi:hypothetical protein